ncbi:L-serine dehydratase [Lachnotalea glycerini]|jgi:L-serine dehydratase|uniref:L-serine dehydratase n=1 Tax=Lachnotalea glycerini TaxID=1763509 RepID=A0A255ILF4_9FIRM|nr:L-serine ammonia-lyase, iron-sulfur-dependent, subunit alpha [Lachnotalea glycerini]PXV91569.1 L-serine dehydratase [Lachnotalea glycerini]RDY28601.1 L-serine ammonia-lyase, iron-sulfur-dependent, subunit alpha [Lachnotalea glycerini]
MLTYKSIEELIKCSIKQNKKISQMVLEDQALQMEKSIDEIYDEMEKSFDVMCEAVVQGQAKNQRSTSGLTGGEGFKMKHYSEQTNGGLSGIFMTKAMSRALAVSGCNASMGKIVATPTAGSCGIMPGCLVSLYEDKSIDKRSIVMSLFTGAAFGIVIADRACIAGAQGGCQAECGSAAGMAAAALVELYGGTPQQCADACAIAIGNQLGLVCDPVAGLVEIPCIKRNVSGVMIAFSSADMALAGIQSEIPVDECIDSMGEVGRALPASLKETALGGLASTPTGLKLKEQVFGN